LTKEDLFAALTALPPNIAALHVIQAVIYGCINYRDSFSDEIRQTGFVYWIPQATFNIGTIPGAQLEIEEFPFGGTLAD